MPHHSDSCSTTEDEAQTAHANKAGGPVHKPQRRRVPLAHANPMEYFERVRLLYASSGPIILGNVLEWYDWTVYGYMEDLIAELFLGGNHTATWLIFAVPFVARPLGSILLGWVADRFGRMVALNTAIWGMAASTVLQGCLVPGSLGAAGALTVLRFVSGLSAGGEAAGVNTYMTEVGGEQILVAAVGVNNVSGSMAFFLANAAALAVHQLPRQDQMQWAWRLPFLVAAPLGVASVLLRRGMAEPSGVHANCSTATCSANTRATVLAVVVLVAINSCNYLPIYLVSWLQKDCGYSATQALGLAAVSKLTQLAITWPVSYVGDYIGSTLTMLAGGATSVLTVLPAFLLVLRTVDYPAGPTLALLVWGLAMPALMAVYNIPGPLFMTSLFPPEVRGRGAGLSLGLASLAGGFMPAICTTLAQQQSWLPGVFVILLMLPSLAALVLSRSLAARRELAVYQRPWLF